MHVGMPTMTTTPISPDLWDDVQQIFAGGGDGLECQCIWPMLRNADASPTSPNERREMFRAELGSTPAPGILLYVDGDPAGWVRVGPRHAQKRVIHMRGIAEASGIPLDDASVWAITCFSVPRAHRGEGIMTHLLAAAVDHARAHGARIIEAYPRDPSQKRTGANELFVGSLRTFTRAGFDVVAPLGSTKQVVQLKL